MWILSNVGEGDEYPQILINIETGAEVRLKNDGISGSIIYLGRYYNPIDGIVGATQRLGWYEEFEEASKDFDRLVEKVKAWKVNLAVDDESDSGSPVERPGRSVSFE